MLPAGHDLHDRLVEVMAQWVRTSWMKRSRGGPAAAARNAAPVGFALPVHGRPAVHEVLMAESDVFAPHETVRDGLPDRDDVLWTPIDGWLRVHLR